MPVSSAAIVVSAMLLLASFVAVYKWKIKSLFALIPLLGIIFYRYNSNIEIYMYMTQAILIGAIIGYNIKEKKSTQFFLISAGLLFAFVFTFYYFYLQNQIGINLIDYYTNNIKMQFSNIDKSVYTEIEKKKFIEFLTFWASIFKKTMASIFFISGIVNSIIFYYPAKFFYMIFVLRKPMQTRGIEFFKLSDNLVFILVGNIVALLVIYNKAMEIPLFIALNILLITLIIYFFQALGVLKYIMIKRKIPNYTFLIIFIMLLIFNYKLLVFLMMILAGVGILDVWADFRKFNIQKEK